MGLELLLMAAYTFVFYIHTPTDKWWVLQVFKNKLCDPQRHNFHFEQWHFD